MRDRKPKQDFRSRDRKRSPAAKQRTLARKAARQVKYATR
jgi:hypothetical protein